MKKSFRLLILFLILYTASFAQKPSYANQCELVRSLLDTTDQRFINFTRISKDSTIIILDINGLLKKCSINVVANIRIIIIDSGAEVEKIRKGGIFATSTREQNVLVLSKGRSKGVIGFDIFHPRSNADCAWGFELKQGIYYFKKKSEGWF